ncbi:LPS export ABC transporter permease LptG [Alsobacter sp. SYSU M60028]|uniref:LPS export ABC transporter permease LptG n=1 Tax=Alsobacter ponti TaxID=2962936 RepID=A0ABT1LH30_9HYPH|nr:LPS export ABC transporter permease LptG [Alsobacter ponti]MCP8940266.1 LPS export ABC transporter permease LptG [Alsobacter ponti]
MVIGKTLGLYLSGKFLRAVAGVFLTVFGLIYTLDFVELVRRTGDVADIPTVLLAQLALFRTPAIAEQILPFAVLFGAMAALLNLSRKLELVVARAAGVSAWQFLFPAIVVATVIGLLTVTVYNPLAQTLKDRATQIEAKRFGKSKPAADQQYWVRQRSVDGQAIVRAERASASGEQLGQVTFFEFDKDGRFQSRVEADTAELRSGFWELQNARLFTPEEEPRSFASYVIATNLTPEQVRQSFSAAQAVPVWDMPALIERTERAGLDATRYRLQYQSLLARPLLFVAMVFVAASVSLRFFRFGGIARMVLGGVACGFLLYVATRLVEDLGAAGILSTTVAAWSPAVVGSLLGTLALLYQEDG